LPAGDNGKKSFGLPGWFGQGRCVASVLDQLTKSTVDEVQVNGNAVIWAIHFDPHTTDSLLALLDSEKLVEKLDRLKVDHQITVPLILCGHTHESKVKKLSADTTVYACGTTSQAFSPQGNDLQLLSIDVDQARVTGVHCALYRYHQNSGQFQLI
jgi:hypothetical protein